MHHQAAADPGHSQRRHRGGPQPRNVRDRNVHAAGFRAVRLHAAVAVQHVRRVADSCRTERRGPGHGVQLQPHARDAAAGGDRRLRGAGGGSHGGSHQQADHEQLRGGQHRGGGAVAGAPDLQELRGRLHRRSEQHHHLHQCGRLHRAHLHHAAGGRRRGHDARLRRQPCHQRHTAGPDHPVPQEHGQGAGGAESQGGQGEGRQGGEEEGVMGVRVSVEGLIKGHLARAPMWPRSARYGAVCGGTLVGFDTAVQCRQVRVKRGLRTRGRQNRTGYWTQGVAC